MKADATTIVYRPVGQKELDLIVESGYRVFPPRLDWQPIFYPVLNEEYETFIARSRTPRMLSQASLDMSSDFEVRSEYLAQFEIQKVSGRNALEYWIPAEQLTEFNNNIVGVIEVISRFGE